MRMPYRLSEADSTGWEDACFNSALASDTKDEFYFYEVVKRLRRNDPSLTEVDLMGMQLGVASFEELAEALPQSTHVEHLNLSETNVDAERLRKILEALVNTPIASLCLAEVPGLGRNIRVLCKLIHSCANLNVLDISDNALGLKPGRVRKLMEQLQQYNPLKVLMLGGNALEQDDFEAVFGMLRANNALEVLDLDLDGTSLTIDMALQLAGALQGNTTLRALRLSLEVATPEDYTILVKKLCSQTVIKELGLVIQQDFYRSDIEPEFFEQIEQVLETNYRLCDLAEDPFGVASEYLERNREIAQYFEPLSEFFHYQRTDKRLIEANLKALMRLVPKLQDEAYVLASPDYIAEHYRLLVALYALAIGEDDEVLDSLKSTLHHKALQPIADKIYAQSLFLIDMKDAEGEKARFKLLAYMFRACPKSSAFATALAGLKGSQSSDAIYKAFNHPRKFSKQAYWLSYEEIQATARRAFSLSGVSVGSPEARLLAHCIQQSTYSLVVVDALCKSRAFVSRVTMDYPKVAVFCCLEAQLGFQGGRSLNGLYKVSDILNAKTRQKITDDFVMRFEERIKTPSVPSLQEALFNLRATLARSVTDEVSNRSLCSRG